MVINASKAYHLRQMKILLQKYFQPIVLYCNITATLIVHSTVKTHNRKKNSPLGYLLPFLIKMLWAFTTSLDEKTCQFKVTIHNSHSNRFRVQSAYLLLLQSLHYSTLDTKSILEFQFRHSKSKYNIEGHCFQIVPSNCFVSRQK